MPKKTTAFNVWENRNDVLKDHTITVSDMHTIYSEIEQAIATGDVALFEKLLKNQFIYPGRLNQRYGVDYDDERGSWYCVEKEYYQTRPVVEALFFDANYKFHHMIHKIRQNEHSAELYAALTRSFEKTDLAKEKLFAWNPDMKKHVNERLDDMKNYGIKLAAKNVAKGETAKELAHELRNRVQELDHLDAKDEHQKNLQILDTKLGLLTKLHESDRDFAVRRGYGRAINIATILFTAAIANMIRLLVTGAFLFFSKTRTQEHVADVQHAMGLSTRQDIKFGR